ncbi:MAG TPA: DUF6265 family protein [Flavobacterium sp.]|nr:DUF6265 family protein [Flavobacterium sp.]
MKKAILFLFLAAILGSCKNGKEAKVRDIEKAAWLVGSWENKSPEGNLSEIWKKENDSVYRGESYFVKAKDTLHFETISLTQSGDVVYYTPTVMGQNGDKPVAFKMISMTDKQMVFENPAHDYPQKIVYTKITNDSLVASISGIQQGKPSAEQYPMGKK